MKIACKVCGAVHEVRKETCMIVCGCYVNGFPNVNIIIFRDEISVGTNSLFTKTIQDAQKDFVKEFGWHIGGAEKYTATELDCLCKDNL